MNNSEKLATYDTQHDDKQNKKHNTICLNTTIQKAFQYCLDGKSGK